MSYHLLIVTTKKSDGYLHRFFNVEVLLLSPTNNLLTQ
jgi:hypothetical protein